MFSQVIDILEKLGYVYLGYWILRFIYYAYILDYDVYERPHHKTDFWDYM